MLTYYYPYLRANTHHPSTTAFTSLLHSNFLAPFSAMQQPLRLGRNFQHILNLRRFFGNEGPNLLPKSRIAIVVH